MEANQLVPITATEETEDTAIMPISSIKNLAAAVQAFNEIKSQILLQNKENYVETTDKRGQKKIFLKRSAWRQVQLAYHLSDEIAKEEVLTDPNDPNVYGYKIWTRVFRGSKSVIGVGMCWSNEPNKTFPHGRHDVYATAHTRSKNRAISDFVGSGEVSAEEMDASSDMTQQPPTAPKLVTSEKICCCGHGKSTHLSDGSQQYCTLCVKLGKTGVKCDLPLGR